MSTGEHFVQTSKPPMVVLLMLVLTGEMTTMLCHGKLIPSTALRVLIVPTKHLKTHPLHGLDYIRGECAKHAERKDVN